MLLNLILPMALSGRPVLILTPFFTLSAIGPPLLYWTAMRYLIPYAAANAKAGLERGILV